MTRTQTEYVPQTLIQTHFTTLPPYCDPTRRVMGAWLAGSANSRAPMRACDCQDYPRYYAGERMGCSGRHSGPPNHQLTYGECTANGQPAECGNGRGHDENSGGRAARATDHRRTAVPLPEQHGTAGEPPAPAAGASALLGLPVGLPRAFAADG